jgi:hypothetical protein
MEMVELRSRKKMNLPESEKRTYCVSCRMNSAELAVLDKFRGGNQRGEALRMLSLSQLPSPIPELNASAWTELSKSASNLNQIARRMNVGESLEIEEIRAELERFRAALLGASI